MARCRSLWETEQLTEALSPAARRLLGLPRRLAARRRGTRSVAYRSRRCGRRSIGWYATAWRRKALAPVGLAFGVVALDGKATSVPTLNHPLVQNHVTDQLVPFGIARTVTCSLVSARGRPCIDAIPIPAATNEMGHFQAAFASLLESYRGLFDVVTYDAGALSEANASAVVSAGKHYPFTLKGEQRTMHPLAGAPQLGPRRARRSDRGTGRGLAAARGHDRHALETPGSQPAARHRRDVRRAAAAVGAGHRGCRSPRPSRRHPRRRGVSPGTAIPIMSGRLRTGPLRCQGSVILSEPTRLARRVARADSASDAAPSTGMEGICGSTSLRTRRNGRES